MNFILFIAICVIPHEYEITFEGRTISVDPEKIEFQDYVPLKPITDLLNIPYVLDNRTQRLYLSHSGKQLELLGDISTVLINDQARHLAFAPLFIKGDVYFPVNEIITTIGGAFDKLLFVKEITEAPIINGINLVTRGDSTVVSFTWNKPITFDVRFYLKKAVIECDGQYQKKDGLKPAGAVTAATLTAHTTYTEVEVDLEGINAYLEREGEVVFYHKITHQVGVIVIDPGHGGVDPGAVGKKGLYEKDANLAISKYLRQFIEDSLGIRVIMTREKDTYLSLRARTKMANKYSADLFVSIHCNASGKSRKMRGFETYFLSEARTTDERAVAMRENASLKFDGIEPASVLDKILLDLAQTAYLEESNCFAESIQESAEEYLSIPSRGVKQAGFYVLRGAFMPAILIECAFVSNLEEEKMLKQKAFRKQLASTIFQGIKRYIQDYERRLNN